MRKSSDQMLRQLYHSSRNPEIDEVKSRFAALNDFVTSRHGWITSIPGNTEVTMERYPAQRCRMISEVSDIKSAKPGRASASWRRRSRSGLRAVQMMSLSR